jgi:hypothetical protein
MIMICSVVAVPMQRPKYILHNSMGVTMVSNRFGIGQATSPTGFLGFSYSIASIGLPVQLFVIV